MSSFPGSPRLLKGGIVLLDPDTSAVLRIITLQYNSDTLTRTLAPKSLKESGDRSEALRLTGPAVETIKLEAEIDATDQLEVADAQTTQFGIHPQLAALETIVYPSSAQLNSNNNLAAFRRPRNRADANATYAFHLEQEPDSSCTTDRLQHHRGSVRHSAESDPGKDQPRDARPERG